MGSDGDDFKNAARALNELNDKDLRKDVYNAFRKAAKPLGVRIVATGAAGLPKRGGLAAEIAKAKMSQSNSTTGRNPGVTMSFKTRPSHNLKAIEAGVLRHPVFARKDHKRVWRKQAVTPGLFGAPFEAGAPAVRREVLNALDMAAETAARRTRTGQ